jgi:hypothetical protein
MRRLDLPDVEVEADSVARTALLAAGYEAPVEWFFYLSKPGDHLAVIHDSRAAIIEMATTLAKVLRGERVGR